VQKPVYTIFSLNYCKTVRESDQLLAFQVGLPAKSAVSGGLVLVIPNVMGIGLWSPPLDPLGNSCRGVQFSRVRWVIHERQQCFVEMITAFEMTNDKHFAFSGMKGNFAILQHSKRLYLFRNS